MTRKYCYSSNYDYQITGEHNEDVYMHSALSIILVDPVNYMTPPKRHHSKLRGNSMQLERHVPAWGCSMILHCGESWNTPNHSKHY